MLNFAQKIIENFSNKVFTLSFTGGSHLLMPIVNGGGSSQCSDLPKSLYLGSTELSTESNIYTESVFEENLAKSRKNKESIDVKRSIIKKMNEKIVSLEKKQKNQKMDIFELQACKNDLLLDFLEYQQSKRKHQQELVQRQNDFDQQEKSFFFMKNQIREAQPQQKERNTINFSKKQSKSTNQIQQQITDIKVKQIQILVPIIKMIDIEIPMLNFGENKIRETGSTSPTNLIKQGEDYFAGISHQINSLYHIEIQHNDRQQNLPLNSSMSGISLNEARVLDLGTERSEKSMGYRHDRRSDRFFTQEEDLIKNLQQKDEICYNQKTQRNNYEKYRQSEENMNKSFDKSRNKSFNCSLKQSILYDELKLNSEISQKQSSNYQQKRINIENQTKDFYKNKITELHQELREKAGMIGDLLRQNEVFLKDIEQLNNGDERKQRVIEGASIKIQILQEKVEGLQKIVREVDETSQENSKKLMNEIYQLSNQVQTKNEEMGLMMDSMEVIEQNAYKKQKDLMKEIQGFESTIQRMKDQIQYYKKRFQQEGIKLNFTEIQMIEEAIEDRENMYETNIQKLKGIYESELSEMKKRFSTLQVETKELQDKNHHLSVESETRSKLIDNGSLLNVREEHIREIMDLYDVELQSRDHEVIALKQELAHCKMALLQAFELVQHNPQHNQAQKHSVAIQCEAEKEKESFRSPHDELVIKILTQKNRCLEQKLSQELTNRKQMTQKLLKLQKLILQDSSSPQSCSNLSLQSSSKKQQDIDEESHEYGLIRALTQQLDKLMKQLKKEKQTNKKLKQQFNEQRPCSPTSESKQIIELKEKLTKLTKYSALLEKQIREIYKVDQCQAHQKIIQRLQNQLKVSSFQRPTDKIESIIKLTQ